MTAPETDNAEGRGPRCTRRTPWIAAVVVVAVAAVAVGVWATDLFGGNRSAADPGKQRSHSPASTTQVTRQTLSQTRTFQGTVGHGSPLSVTAATQGTVTRIGKEGTAIARGAELYRIDERPTVAVFGSIPSYRDLKPGDRGTDVKQFEENLAALGYKGFDVDDTFTSTTAQAVRKWQADVGTEVTGTVAASSIAVVPEGSRVDAFHVQPGNTVMPGSAVVDVTSSAQIVTLDITTRDRDLFRAGTTVTMRPPGTARTSTATVRSITVKPAAAEGGQQGSGSGEKKTDATVEASLRDKVDANLLGATVDVDVVITTHRNVLTVPVNALLAYSGGYGLEVVAKDGTTTIVPVTTGLFASGRVEVTGIDEGATVGVAGR